MTPKPLLPQHRLPRGRSTFGSLLVLVLLTGAPGWASRAAPTSESEPEICVIAPRVESDAEGRVGGTVPSATPTLVVAEPLSELRIERGGRLIWRGRWRRACARARRSDGPWYP